MSAIELLFVASLYAPALAILVGVLALAMPRRGNRQRTESTAAAAH